MSNPCIAPSPCGTLTLAYTSDHAKVPYLVISGAFSRHPLGLLTRLTSQTCGFVDAVRVSSDSLRDLQRIDCVSFIATRMSCPFFWW
jgi:hypothetical protein